MNKLQVKWTQEKVSAIAVGRGAFNRTAARNFSAKILRTNEGIQRTRLIVISGRAELKANVTSVQHIAA